MPRVKRALPAAAPRFAEGGRMQDRPGRWKLIWRRQKRMVRPAIAVAGLLALGLFAAGLAHMLGQGASFGERVASSSSRLGLRVSNIVIEGRSKTPEPLLRAALGLHAGDPILAFSVAAARARLETINWVQTATVERRLPGTVLIRLTERRPFAVWQHEGKFELIDRDGNMVADSDVATFANQLPLVVGTGAPHAAAALLDALAAQPDLLSRMVAAVRVGDRRWNLHMKNNADVLLPEGAEVPALAKLAELQSQHALLDRPLQTIDLRLPDRLVLRPQPEKPVEKAGDRPDSRNPPARRPT
jgi:cell division protein FtsQ